MAPLRSKLNHTLHKLNDKIKRHSGRSSNNSPQQPGDAAPQKHQPRASPAEGSLLPPLGQGYDTSLSINMVSGLPDDPMGLTSGTGSVMSWNFDEDTAYGDGAPSVTGSSGAPLNSYQYHQPSTSHGQLSATPMQAAAQSAGSLANPIDLTGNSNPPPKGTPGHHPSNTNDLTSPSPTSTPHGQKRPSLLDPSDVDYAVGQKSKMYRSASNPHTDVAFHRTMRPTVQSNFEPPNSQGPLHVQPPTRPSGQATESHVQSTGYQTEDDLAAFSEKILRSSCQSCTSARFNGVEGIVARTRENLSAKVPLHPYHACAKCKAVRCVGCGAGFIGHLDPSSTGCCTVGRLFLLYSLCCGPEFKKLEVSTTAPTLSGMGKLKGKLKGQKAGTSAAPTPASNPAGKAKEPPPRALSKGVGYGSEDYYMTGEMPGNNRWEANLATYGNLPTPEEKLLAAYFSGLRDVLASFGNNQQQHNHQRLPPMDKPQPPAMVKFILRRSPLLLRAAELLRIDSIEAMSVRTEIYEPLLGLVAVIGRYPSIWTVVYHKLTMYPTQEQLGHFASSRSNSQAASASNTRPNTRSTNVKGKQSEEGSSIVKIIENLARQCRHLKQVASAMEEASLGESSQMLDLSRVICDLAAEHEANPGLRVEYNDSLTSPDAAMPPTPGLSNVLTRSKEAEKAREEFKDLHRNLCITELSDNEILRNFKYQNEALRVNAAMTAKGRMKKLVAQIANLRTSLPEGIWVRHGSSRLDIMKVLMVGPKCTPYEHGLFEFDLFCPAQFPMIPPWMFFRTTGGGKIRFNPNLYNDGKVCLSLLGTWSGESWKAAYSTLLQVLVSIHGMILVDQPWYNEPGREQRQDKHASRQYNAQIQGYTVQWAITDWLNTRLAPSSSAAPAGSRQATATTGGGRPGNLLPPSSAVQMPDGESAPVVARDDPVWGDVIRKHFAANGKTIWDTASKKWKVPKDELARLHDALGRHRFL
ncbi:hypothetical protein GE09DRAFT_1215847 [Coniochaeta sp. 2T2.1]|nr:hypothetical protein GE09DRAFT_1215847 [Coniochaeta sp. 2T2.1]